MFQIDGSIIPSEELTNKIRKKMYEKGVPEDRHIPSGNMFASDIDFYELRRELSSLQENVMALNSMWTIMDAPIVSSKRYISKQVIFIKRVIRRCLRWLLRPYFDQITNFNGAVTRAISDTMKIQEELIDKLEMMTQEENYEN